MPRGFTDSIHRAKESFEELKKESLLKGKNVANISNVAKNSGTSRTNLYDQKNEEWKQLREDIDLFSKEFKSLSKGKYKNPVVEKYKEESKSWEEKYKSMSSQNLELLDRINSLEQIIDEKQSTIYLLQKRLGEREELLLKLSKQKEEI